MSIDSRPPEHGADGGPPIPEGSSPTAARDGLKGGELNAAITSALVGIQTEYLGRGPRRASTFHYGHVLVTLMHDVLTPAEKSLTRTNQADAWTTSATCSGRRWRRTSARRSSVSRVAACWRSSAATTSTLTSRQSCSSSPRHCEAEPLGMLLPSREPAGPRKITGDRPR